MGWLVYFPALIILDILIYGTVLSIALVITLFFITLIRYRQGKHLVDVTEIFNMLPQEKKQRLFKLIYIIVILFLSLFWYGDYKKTSYPSKSCAVNLLFLHLCFAAGWSTHHWRTIMNNWRWYLFCGLVPGRIQCSEVNWTELPDTCKWE